MQLFNKDRIRTAQDGQPLLGDVEGHADDPVMAVLARLAEALALRASLPAGALLVVQGGHLVDAHSVRFYAPDSEQAGLLARQQEIENLQREIKARQLIADQSRSAVAQAESAWQQVSQALPPMRQRVGEVTRRLHDLQLEQTRLLQQVEQTRERSGRLEQDLAEVASQQEELQATKIEAETRFEELDAEIATLQEAYSEAEMAGEVLADEAQTARDRLRDQERGAQEAEFSHFSKNGGVHFFVTESL